MYKEIFLAALAGVILPVGTSSSRGNVTAFQNGVLPTPDYDGCQDTWISDEDWERNHDHGSSEVLRCGGKRHILMQFDLSSIPKEDVIYKAVLHLANVAYPRKQEGKFPTALFCYSLTSEWNENANWLEHTRTDYDESDEGNWRTPGGDIDVATDFDHEPKGVIASDSLIDGSWGHMHELELTALVRRWHNGELANYGLLLKGEHCQLASNEWYVPTFRPQLLVAHGREDSPPVDIAPLMLVPKEMVLDPIAATTDTGKAKGDYAVLCVGQNSNCALRGASTDAYIKEAVEKYPGDWGWMTTCRVGGRAGDFSRALLYFDLSEIPGDVSIKEAKLRLSLTPHTNAQATEYKYGAFLLRLPDAPGWQAEEVTPFQRNVGIPWPEGGIMTASKGKPLAIGEVITKTENNRTIPLAVEFDFTGIARAWVQKKVSNCGIVLDNRIEGGAYDFYSSRSFEPELRPYLEITLSPAIARKPELIKVEPGLPAEDYWVEPMREVRKKFKGTPGTLGQYGDSITVTMAFLAGYSSGDEITPENCPAEVKKELDVVAEYSKRDLWREWKGGEWGNTGMMMSDWLLANIDGWQKKMNPEVAVIMFGTNDIGRLWPPEYTENMATSIRRMLADGTIPMLTSIPPCAKEGAREYWLAALSIARSLKIPLIDYYDEIVRRRPDDWNGALEKFSEYEGYDVPTPVSRDGAHPSHPAQYRNDFSAEALSCNGYGLRNYMTLRKYYEVITKVLKP